MKKKVGIYGGSFDPVHQGHLNVAAEMMEIHHLDQIWFCPTSSNPLKSAAPITEPQHRLNMLQLAIEGAPKFHVIDLEIFLPGPAYTIDTLEALIKQWGEQFTFSLIIGKDSAKEFFRWRSPEKIVSLVPLLVASRMDTSFKEGPSGSVDTKSCIAGSPTVLAAIDKGMTSIRRMDITSTELRNRLHAGRYCGHLMQRKVLDYIAAHRLYS